METGGKGGQILQLLWRGIGRAEEVVRNPRELLGLLAAAERRLNGLPAGKLTPVKTDLQALLRLLQAYGEGRYHDVSGRNLALAGLGVVYLVSPLDVLPDFIPGGFADDAAIVGFILKKLRAELVKFEAWERGRGLPSG